MSIRTSPWPDGVPCWADLAVPDVPAAKQFYSAVLGWSFGPEDERFGGYAIAEVDGAATAGIGVQGEGMPVAWTLYLASSDADATAAAVRAAGGTLAMQPDDVGTLGRMFVALDPSGAAFGVWQAGTHIGASLVNEPGGLSWEDLRSSAPADAQAFYAAVFGYSYRPLEMAGPDYATFSLADGVPLGGMGGMMGMEGFPSHWLVYFGVASAAAAAAAAHEHGGHVLMEPFPTPFGVMAALTDPAGAAFWVVETAGADLPDRSG